MASKLLIQVFGVFCRRRLFGREQTHVCFIRTVGRTERRPFCNKCEAKQSLVERSHASVHLHSLLQCTLQEAQVLLTLHPSLRKQSPHSTSQLVTVLMQKGLTLTQIRNNPFVLATSLDVLQSKLAIVSSRIGGLTDATVPLLALPVMMLLRVARSWARDAEAGHPNRISYLVKQLECSEAILGQQFPKHAPILLMDFTRLDFVMQLLKTNGVSAESILNDLWIFRHNRERMSARLELLHEYSVTDLRPWMLRCPDETLDKFLDKWKQHRHVLKPHRDVAEYLAKRLVCSPKDVHTELVEKNPVLLRTKPVKVKQVIDWLFEKGFTAKHIRNSPRIFEVSLESLQTRLHQLSQCNYQPRSLSILWVEWKVFDRHVRKLKEKCKKNRTKI